MTYLAEVLDDNVAKRPVRPGEYSTPYEARRACAYWAGHALHWRQRADALWEARGEDCWYRVSALAAPLRQP